MTTAVLQALAMGLPAITTDHGAFSEQIKEGQNGFLVPEGDYKVLAEKILFMMEHPETWPAMGRFGRDHVAKNFDLTTLMDKQIQIYEEILNSKD